MVKYSLDHLTQEDNQYVGGPIQDDEALLLFALIRVMRIKRILEIGGLGGYSARNFIKACGPRAQIYSVDLNACPSQGPEHKTICKDAGLINAGDVDGQALDMVFFDCHAYRAQMQAFDTLSRAGIINKNTILALHDTNLLPSNIFPSLQVEGGWCHIVEEANMVNKFKEMGYDIFCLHTQMEVHAEADEQLPYRWGLTIARRFQPLPIPEGWVET